MKKLLSALVAISILGTAAFADSKLTFHNQSGAVIHVWTDSEGGHKDWSTINQHTIEWQRDKPFKVHIQPWGFFQAYGVTDYMIGENEKLTITYTGPFGGLKVDVKREILDRSLICKIPTDIPRWQQDAWKKVCEEKGKKVI